MSVGFSAMWLRCGCDLAAMRSVNHSVILLTTLCCRRGSLCLWLAAELDGYHCPDAGPYSFGARRNTLWQAGTLRGMEARLGADTFACFVWGQSCSPNDCGKAFARRGIPHAIEFSYGFQRISFQNAFLRWVFLLQLDEMGPKM